jgi:mannose-6-phosphate isomerase-like protein (cupin superfamily)
MVFGPMAEEIVFGGTTILVRTTANDSGGTITVLEEGPPMLDTPLHVHSKEDELFYVMEGEHMVTRGDEELRLGPGEAIFLPREVPHAQRRVVPGEGRQLVICTPGGFEQFFRDLAEADQEGRLGPEAYAAASEKAGITWL